MKAEQKARSEEIERISTLRTRKMRETDMQKELKRTYKYTLIRTRFPNNYILQVILKNLKLRKYFKGIFNVNESLLDVREFIENNLKNVLGSFELTLSYLTNSKLVDDKTILDYELVPSALLHFQWNNDVFVSFFFIKSLKIKFWNKIF